MSRRPWRAQSLIGVGRWVAVVWVEDRTGLAPVQDRNPCFQTLVLVASISVFIFDFYICVLCLLFGCWESEMLRGFHTKTCPALLNPHPPLLITLHHTDFPIFVRFAGGKSSTRRGAGQGGGKKCGNPPCPAPCTPLVRNSTLIWSPAFKLGSPSKAHNLLNGPKLVYCYNISVSYWEEINNSHRVSGL